MIRWATLLVLVLAGCDGAARAPLAVDVTSDYAVGPEQTVSHARIEMSRGDGSPTLTIERVFEADESLLEGARVADFEALELGSWTLTVSFLGGRDEAVVDRRRGQIALSGPRVVTMLLTHTCRDVTCPVEGGSIDATECRRGACVDLECALTGECLAPECAEDGDCGEGPECISYRCVDGACLAVSDDAVCSTRERCDMTVGCGCAGAVTGTGIHVPADGRFLLRRSPTGGAVDIETIYGPVGAVGVVGDWDGDGADEPGSFTRGDAMWRLSGHEGPDIQFGGADWEPVVGDWDGDGDDTIGLFSPATRTFYLRNENQPGAPDHEFVFGPANSLPIAGDWDADGVQTVGVYEPTTGTFHLTNQHGEQPASHTFVFGPANARPVAGDWDGDCVDTVGVYLDDTFHLSDALDGSSLRATYAYGFPGAAPVAGRFAPE